MLFPKSKRIENKKLVKEVAQQPCAACGIRPPADGANDPHHITTVGAFGDDTSENLIPLCRKHHVEWHKAGPSRMIDRYFGVERWLVRNGRFDILEKGRSK